MKTTAKQEKARRLRVELTDCTDALYADRVTNEMHRATNRCIWDRIERAGVRDLVLAMISDDERVRGGRVIARAADVRLADRKMTSLIVGGRIASTEWRDGSWPRVGQWRFVSRGIGADGAEMKRNPAFSSLRARIPSGESSLGAMTTEGDVRTRRGSRIWLASGIA